MGSLFLTNAAFTTAVRGYIRDKAELNALLDDVETSDFLIDMCRDLAIDDFNTSPPLIGRYTISTFPSDSLLMWGTVIQILISAGLLQSRNQLDYVEGGLTVQTSNKTPLYQSWLNFLIQQYEFKKASLKKSINAESCYGGVPSEYALINYFGSMGPFGIDSVNLARSGLFL